MAADRQQLWFWMPPCPMRKIISQEWLRAVPASPGVYIMSGRFTPRSEPTVLYIGKSINLRRRLASYRSVRSDRVSRRLVRLAFSVESITWETCADDQEARLRENFLLRLHRPKFNSANTHPESYRYVMLRMTDGFLELEWVREPGNQGDCFGAFKHSAGFFALQRVLWAALNPPHAAHIIPASLFGPKPPKSIRLVWQSFHGDALEFRALCLKLRAFLAGSSPELVTWLGDRLAAAMAQSSFALAWLTADLQRLEVFFTRGTGRNGILHSQLDFPGTILEKMELDDLLVLTRACPVSRTASGATGRA